MDIASAIGHSAREAVYIVPDSELAVGSTLGGPTICTVLKGTGAIEKIYGIETGQTVFGSLVLHHWDEQTGMPLDPAGGGTFTLHAEHQERNFTVENQIAIHEDIFVLSGHPTKTESVDPPAVYYTVELRNDGDTTATIATYAFCQVCGSGGPDVEATFDRKLGALLIWNRSNPDLVRVFGCSEQPAGFETTLDHGKAVGVNCPRSALRNDRCLRWGRLGRAVSLARAQAGRTDLLLLSAYRVE